MASLTPLRSSLTRSATTITTTATTRTTTIAATACQSTISRAPFSTTTPLSAKTFKPNRLPSRVIPAYPYGPSQVYKQSDRGLYGGARIQFGNNVSDEHSVKTRRFWRPNVHVKVYRSPALGGANVKVRLTLRVLKTIAREGGLENYLLKDKPARVKEMGPSGWKLRWLLMQTRAVQVRFNDERARLGLDRKPLVDNDDVVQYAMDHATPGPLSQRSRRTLGEIERLEAMEFVIGDESLASVEGVQVLTEEAEAKLLRENEIKQTGKGRQALSA